jgi:hypothetical protein
MTIPDRISPRPAPSGWHRTCVMGAGFPRWPRGPARGRTSWSSERVDFLLSFRSRRSQLRRRVCRASPGQCCDARRTDASLRFAPLARHCRRSRQPRGAGPPGGSSLAAGPGTQHGSGRCRIHLGRICPGAQDRTRPGGRSAGPRCCPPCHRDGSPDRHHGPRRGPGSVGRTAAHDGTPASTAGGGGPSRGRFRAGSSRHGNRIADRHCTTCSAARRRRSESRSGPPAWREGAGGTPLTRRLR